MSTPATVRIFNKGGNRFRYQIPGENDISILGPLDSADIPLSVWSHCKKVLGKHQLSHLLEGGETRNADAAVLLAAAQAASKVKDDTIAKLGSETEQLRKQLADLLKKTAR